MQQNKEMQAPLYASEFGTKPTILTVINHYLQRLALPFHMLVYLNLSSPKQKKPKKGKRKQCRDGKKQRKVKHIQPIAATIHRKEGRNAESRRTIYCCSKLMALIQ